MLIVRHAEKPAAGPRLAPEGEIRAKRYAAYFEPFAETGQTFRVDALYAGADSDNSYRPRLTLEPLSRATGMPLHLEAGTKEPEKLVRELRTDLHGSHPLIAWRHGQIPDLLRAFGADAKAMLPDGKWPDEVYDWVILLRFNNTGALQEQQLFHEHLDASDR